MGWDFYPLPFMLFMSFCFFCVFGMVGGLVFGGTMYCTKRAGPRSLMFGALVVPLIACGAYALFLTALVGSKYFPLWAIGSSAAVIAAFIAAFATAYQAKESIEHHFRAVNEMTELGEQFVPIFDADGDGVICAKDIEATAQQALAAGISKTTVDLMRYSISTFGHDVGQGVHVIGRDDPKAARAKLREEFKNWLAVLPAELVA